MLAATIASSVVQPIFGHVFDTRRGEWLLVAGPAVAGLGIGALAFAHTFAVAIVCVLIGSLGVAAFHPEASKYAAWLSGERRSTAMAVFSVGGNLGVAAGPLLAGLIAAQFGLAGVWLLAIPGLAIAVAQLAGLAALGGATAHARVARAHAGRDRWGAMSLLLVALAVRGYVHFGLLTFIPLLEHDARHNSGGYGSRVLALMLFAGVLGTLAAGRWPTATAATRAHADVPAPPPASRSTSRNLACWASPVSRSRAHASSRRSGSRSSSRRSTAEQARDRGRPVHRALDRPRRRRVLRHRRAGRFGRARRRALDDPSGNRAWRRAVRPATGSRRARSRHVGARPARASPARDDVLETLAGGRFDLLVVGGGIVGCASPGSGRARACASRWWSAVTSRGATSSASSKLIHGGLRYLQMGDIGLVREAHAERHALARVVAPHLVRPRAFLVPVYRGGPVAGDEVAGRARALRRPRALQDGGGSLLRPRAARSLVPPLRTAGLRSAGRYVDHETNDARMTIAVARAAALAGACIATRVEVGALRLAGGRVAGAECTDVLGGGAIRSRDLRRQRDRSMGRRGEAHGRSRGPRSLRFAKGAHLIVRLDEPWQRRADHTARGRARPVRESLGGRPARRHDRRALRGRSPRPRGHGRRRRADVQESRASIEPGIVERGRILSSFAGCACCRRAMARRPRLAGDRVERGAGACSPSPEQVHDVRRIALDALARIRGDLGLRTLERAPVPLPGAATGGRRRPAVARPSNAPVRGAHHLSRFHGSDALELLAPARENPSLLEHWRRAARGRGEVARRASANGPHGRRRAGAPHDARLAGASRGRRARVEELLVAARYVAALDQGTTTPAACCSTERGRAVAEPSASTARSCRARAGSSTTPSRSGASRRHRRGARSAGARPATWPAIGITNQRETRSVGPREPAGRSTTRSSGRTRAPPSGGRRGRRRSTLPRADGCRSRPILGPKVAWMLDNVARCARAGRGRGARFRHDRHLADLEPRRACPRHRRHQREPHAADGSRARSTGTTSCSRRSASRARCCRRSSRPPVGGARRGARGDAGRRASSAISRRRCSGRLLRAGRVEEHLRHRQLPAAEHRHRHRPLRARADHDRRLPLGDEPAHYALEGSIAVTGSLVQWLRDNLGHHQHASEIEALAASVTTTTAARTSCPRSRACSRPTGAPTPAA